MGRRTPRRGRPAGDGDAGVRAAWGGGAGVLHVVLPDVTAWRVAPRGSHRYRADVDGADNDRARRHRRHRGRPGAGAGAVQRESAELAEAGAALADTGAAFAHNRKRWQGYLDRALRDDAPLLRRRRPRCRLAVKAVMTLANNWRAPRRARCATTASSCPARWPTSTGSGRGTRGSTPPRWPSSRRSWPARRSGHAGAAERRGNGGRLRVRRRSQDNWLNTKPPLAAWAVAAVYAATGDKEFVRDVPAAVALPSLVRAAGPRSRRTVRVRGHPRRPDRCQMGERHGQRGPLRRRARLVAHGPGAWTLDQASADLNAYLYAEKRCLARMARLIGRPGDATRWRGKPAGLQPVRSRMFDETAGLFADIRLADGAFVRAPGPEAWIPLWAGVATAGPGGADPRRADGLHPFPHPPPLSKLADHPAAALDGYWRGPVWLDQAYFGLAGPRPRRLPPGGGRARRTAPGQPAGADSPAPLRENYDPLTGRGPRRPYLS